MICRMRLHRQVRSGDGPRQFREDHFKCTMKKPEDRYQTADELIIDLKLVFEDNLQYVGIVPTIDDSPTIMIDQNGTETENPDK